MVEYVFLSNVIFGLNILSVVVFFLLMFYYAHKRGFLEEYTSEEDKKHVYNTLYIVMGATVIVNLLDFNVNPNFIYLFLLVPIISTIRHIQYMMKPYSIHDETSMMKSMIEELEKI